MLSFVWVFGYHGEEGFSRGFPIAFEKRLIFFMIITTDGNTHGNREL